MHISIFDLDKTLINVNCSIHFYNFLREQKIFSHRSFFSAANYWLQYRFLDLSAAFLHEKIFHHFLKGKEARQIFSYVETFWEKNFDRFCNPSIMSYLEKAKKQNHYLLLFSSSPAFLVSYLTKKIPLDEIYATEYAVDSKGDFQKVLTVIDGEEKRRLALKIAEQRNLPTKSISAYSDSYRDAPLLRIAGKAYIVNPDKRLKKMAKQNDWELI